MHVMGEFDVVGPPHLRRLSSVPVAVNSLGSNAKLGLGKIPVAHEEVGSHGEFAKQFAVGKSPPALFFAIEPCSSICVIEVLRKAFEALLGITHL